MHVLEFVYSHKGMQVGNDILVSASLVIRYLEAFNISAKEKSLANFFFPSAHFSFLNFIEVERVEM